MSSRTSHLKYSITVKFLIWVQDSFLNRVCLAVPRCYTNDTCSGVLWLWKWMLDASQFENISLTPVTLRMTYWNSWFSKWFFDALSGWNFTDLPHVSIDTQDWKVKFHLELAFRRWRVWCIVTENLKAEMSLVKDEWAFEDWGGRLVAREEGNTLKRFTDLKSQTGTFHFPCWKYFCLSSEKSLNIILFLSPWFAEQKTILKIKLICNI